MSAPRACDTIGAAGGVGPSATAWPGDSPGRCCVLPASARPQIGGGHGYIRAVRRLVPVLIGICLFVAACSGSSDTDEASARATPTAPQAQILPPADLGESDTLTDPETAEVEDDGRLVVQDAADQLATMLPDGSEVELLTDDPTKRHTQPSWAPDGSRVAWVSVDRTTGASSLDTDRFDRSDLRTVELDTVPFYLYWDPSAERVAHLSPSAGGIDLGVAEPLSEEPGTRRIDRGSPFFFSWGPDGDELIVNASGFRFDRIDLGSATIIVDEFPGKFGAPTWLPDGSVVYADSDDDGQYLVTTGASGEGRRPLISYQGELRFAVSNEGNRIAMQATPSRQDNGVVTASFGAADDLQTQTIVLQDPTPTPEFDASLDAVEPLIPGVPYIMGTFGGEPFQLSSEPAIALLPSPNGQSTAWLEAEQRGDGTLRWHFDINGQAARSFAFVPSAETAQNYLPFFDQYSQSHDFWSPSGRFFVFAGRPAGTDELDGIWVFDTTTGTPERIADGVFAAFTRTPEAGGAASAL